MNTMLSKEARWTRTCMRSDSLEVQPDEADLSAGFTLTVTERGKGCFWVTDLCLRGVFILSELIGLP